MTIEDHLTAVENPRARKALQDSCGRNIVARFCVSVVAANAIAYALYRECGMENYAAIAGAHVAASITGVFAGAQWTRHWYRSYWLSQYSSVDKKPQ